MNVEGLISDLAFILLLGAVVTVLFKWIKQPVVLGYIVAGFLASPHFEYLPSVTTEENIDFWAQIGIVVLLFSLGLEFSFKKLVNSGGSAVVTALIIVTGSRLLNRPSAALQLHQQPLSRRHVVHVIDNNYHKGTQRPRIEAAEVCHPGARRAYCRRPLCRGDDGHIVVNRHQQHCSGI